MSKCNVCKNVFFRSEGDRKLHLITDSHIKRFYKPEFYIELDTLKQTRDSLMKEKWEIDCKKQKKLLTRQIMELDRKIDELSPLDTGATPQQINDYLKKLHTI